MNRFRPVLLTLLPPQKINSKGHHFRRDKDALGSQSWSCHASSHWAHGRQNDFDWPWQRAVSHFLKIFLNNKMFSYDYKSMFHHIWLKLNVKLGGTNQIVDFTYVSPSLRHLDDWYIVGNVESTLPSHDQGSKWARPSATSISRAYNVHRNRRHSSIAEFAHSKLHSSSHCGQSR